MSILREWAAEFGVPMLAIAALEARMGLDGTEGDAVHTGKGESYVQSLVVLEAPKHGARLFRNNVGAFQDKSGAWVRYGLANESGKRNARLKSSDLVGWRKRVITQAMVGSVIGQCVLREMKEPGWHYTGDEHEQAQLKFIQIALADGCDAAFCTGTGSFK